MTHSSQVARKRLVIVANRTGGQGKTLASQLIAYASARAGRPLVTVAADAQSTAVAGARPAAGTPVAESRSKLSKIIHGTIDLGIGGSVIDGGDAATILGHWDRLADIAEFNDTLLDVGANVIDQIQGWAKSGQFSEALPHVDVDLVVPFQRQPQPIADAMAMVLELVGEEGIAFRNVYLLQNDHGAAGSGEAEVGKFVNDLRKHATTLYDRVGGIGLVSLPAVGPSQPTDRRSTLMADFERGHWHVGAIEGLVPTPTGGVPFTLVPVRQSRAPIDAGEVAEAEAASAAATAKFAVDVAEVSAKVAGLQPMARNREVRGMRGWLALAIGNLDAAGVLDGRPLDALSQGEAAESLIPYRFKDAVASPTGRAGRPAAAKQVVGGDAVVRGDEPVVSGSMREVMP